MSRRWRVRPFDEGRVRDLARAANLPSVVAQLLLSRGLSDAALAREFLDAKLTGLREPSQLPGVSSAVERIRHAIGQGWPITVYGDYDADGITGTAILLRTLEALQARVDFYVPHRIDEGYGLHEQAIRYLADKGTRLLISVDCGIGCVHEAEVARSLGMQLVVTDHHEPSNQLPDANAIVHPKLPPFIYPFTGLSGAGVAFKLAWELCKASGSQDRVPPRLRKLLLSCVGLAALGTVADVVPLLDENRLLVRHGLVSLRVEPFAGIAALLETARLKDKPGIHSEDLAFTLAPRLNAAGRLGQAQLAVELLTTDSPERARELARYLEELNQQRGGLERGIFLSAQRKLSPAGGPPTEPAIVLASRNWHVGVVGIVAGRLAEHYQRPTILISLDRLGDGKGTGSARSALGVDLYQALSACREHLLSFGGHAAAAGLKISTSQLEPFRQAFYKHVDQLLPHDRSPPELEIDAEAPLPQLTLKTVDQIQQLAPFGRDNPRPVLCATEVELDGSPRCMGEGDRHLSLKLRQHSVSLRAVAFGQGEWARPLQECTGPIDVAYRPVINEFRGRRSVELQLVDWRPSDSSST